MWMNFGIKDLIDVLLVAFFLYQTYKLMKNSGTLAIFSGVVSFIIVWILVYACLDGKRSTCRTICPQHFQVMCSGSQCIQVRGFQSNNG